MDQPAGVGRTSSGDQQHVWRITAHAGDGRDERAQPVLWAEGGVVSGRKRDLLVAFRWVAGRRERSSLPFTGEGQEGRRYSSA